MSRTKAKTCRACNSIVEDKTGYRISLQAFDRTRSQWASNAMFIHHSAIYCSLACAQEDSLKAVKEGFEQELQLILNPKKT